MAMNRNMGMNLNLNVNSSSAAAATVANYNSNGRGSMLDGSVTAGNLLDLYNSAISYCRNPLNAGRDSAQIFQQLQWGVEKLQGVSKEDFPDDLLEECDVGPRPFRRAMFPDATMSCNLLYTELLMMYNKGLVHHFSRAEYGEATKNYEAIDFALAKLVPANMLPPSSASSGHHYQQILIVYNKLMELRMRVNNNMGQITYLLGLEDTAQANFEAALIFAKHIAGEGSSRPLKLATATVLSNWCRVHYMTGDVNDEVHAGLEEVLRIRSSILGWNHRDVASAHYNLGVAKYATGFSDNALSHLFSYLQVAAHEAKEAKEESVRNGSSSSTTPLQTKQPLDPIPP